MVINGVELSTLGIQLYDRVITSNKVETTQEWLEGDIHPTFIRQQDKFKQMTLKFLITEQNEDEAFHSMSVVTQLLRRASIVFDDMDLIFDVTMDGEATQERLKNGNFILTVKLNSDYARGETEVYTTDTSATSFFKLNVAYYRDNNYLISTESIVIHGNDFKDDTTLESLGIVLNKYKPEYYNDGATTNMGNMELSYVNLMALQTIIINYSPIVYTKQVEYFIGDDNGLYNSAAVLNVSFTKPKFDNCSSIGQLFNMSYSKPDGYKATINFNKDFTFDNILAWEPYQIYYDKLANDRAITVTVKYVEEAPNGSDSGVIIDINTATLVIKESSLVDGTALRDLINVNAYKPEKYYKDGLCLEEDLDALLSFDDLRSEYTIKYNLQEYPVYVEYYLGEYPNWNRINSVLHTVKYDTAYENTEDIYATANINLNKYHNEAYQPGKVFSTGAIVDFESLISVGLVQVFYTPINYTLPVKYYQISDDGLTNDYLGEKDVTINDYMFLGAPKLFDIIEINAFKNDGYIFDAEHSYNGEVTLSALLAAAPIEIIYKAVDAIRTKSVIVKYKQEQASAYSTINTSILTFEESEIGSGIRLGTLLNLDAYKPDYYKSGIVDGYSNNTVVTFDEIQGSYDILYLAENYKLPVRYYTDEVSNYNWIGSDTITYNILSFDINTTLVDLGLNVDIFKPVNCSSGVIQYTGPINFAALHNLDGIDVVYTTVAEPGDDGFDYPHRILFLQHNDMGDWENQFPTWTLNHAYINTGVTVDDMSKLSVVMNTVRVFEDQPLHNVNVGSSYLFGSVAGSGAYYLKYTNNTKYCSAAAATGINTYSAMCGSGTPELVLTEESAVGFSANTGIVSSTRSGYSYATFTYSNLLQSNSARMSVPLYLFACNYNGHYQGGIAGVGIKSCKIYYDDILIRDFIPVQFYDKIGDKVAPSNCLYDKISQAFFEDGTGKNSFNIMDDDAYTDTNPEHQIGCCYVNYMKDNAVFNTTTIYFRASDILNGEWDDLYSSLFVDYYQPQFYSKGEIQGAETFDVTFNNLNGHIFNVVYHESPYTITVKYWNDAVGADADALAIEYITLKESDFYQVPTLGEIIDLNKYKTDGYKASHDYTGVKVTLNRLLQASPINVIYNHIEEPTVYTTTVKYYKRSYGIDVVHPINMYTLIGTKELEIDETWFVEGVYPEQFMEFNLFKPAKYYDNGEAYEWYTKDEMLLEPSDLRSEYSIVYEPLWYALPVNYYQDEVNEDNLIASTTWNLKITDWHEGEEFQLIDELPNDYLDKYRPMICGGGHLVNPEKWYTFDSLMEQGEVAILYETKQEPHDPDDTSFPTKVIYYRQKGFDWIHQNVSGYVHGTAEDRYDQNLGAKIPWLDLGYTPKEIGRLKIETKAYSLLQGRHGSANSFDLSGDGFSYFLGYYGAEDLNLVPKTTGNKDADKAMYGDFYNKSQTFGSGISNASSGCFAFKGHKITGTGLVYTSADYQYLDGHPYITAGASEQMPVPLQPGYNLETVRELVGYYRKGYYGYYDNDLEPFVNYYNYGYSIRSAFWNYSAYGSGLENPYLWKWDETNHMDSQKWPNRSSNLSNPWKISGGNAASNSELAGFGQCVAFNPITMTLDAYNDYIEWYDYQCSENPHYENIENKDTDIFARRCTPKGPIRAFITTHPDTGAANICPMTFSSYYQFTGFYGAWGSQLQHAMMGNAGNPYSSSFSGEITVSQQTIVDWSTNDQGEKNPVYSTTEKRVSLMYADKGMAMFSVPMSTMIWYIKIWDRGKLVRDLIPVAKGDQIYDYVAQANGMFDKVTEMFFYNQNDGGTYSMKDKITGNKFNVTIAPDDVIPFEVEPDPTLWGKIVVNYYDENNEFLGNQYVEIPVEWEESNKSIYEYLHNNDFKPNEYYHDGMLDVDSEISDQDTDDKVTMKKIFEAGGCNIYYKLKNYTKTINYYYGNTRVASKDVFYTIKEIEAAETLADLGLDVNLYANEYFGNPTIHFNEQILANDDIQAFIDAPAPVVTYEPIGESNLFYTEYYRGGAYDDTLITVNPDDPNYLDCELDARVLNTNGAIRYLKHYHEALYEDETQPYFISYQVDVTAKYVPVHKGPARRYPVLAEIVDQGRYTVIEQRGNWGRLKEYPKGWILLSYTESVVGPGQNPDYDNPTNADTIIPFATVITINKMTIDRLWCYSPEYASWIKAEDISFDQSGKLYNAIGINVYDLTNAASDGSGWSGITGAQLVYHSRIDTGGMIAPNAYKLFYHDNAVWSYPAADYTLAGIKNLHKIEFVYPETQYAYSIIYYKDLVKSSNIVGRDSFSLSMSDWNPDWDKFLETSYRSGVIPTIYRGTPLWLTWENLGISANEYKPDSSYDDGLWLWRPKTYIKELRFTFEELITTGVQRVLYMPTIQKYRMLVKSGLFSLDTGMTPKGDRTWEVDRDTKITADMIWDRDRDPGIYEWEFSYSPISTGGKKLLKYKDGTNNLGNYYRYEEYFNCILSRNFDTNKPSVKGTTLAPGYHYSRNGSYIYSYSPITYYSPNNGKISTITNWSEKRNETCAIRYKNSQTGFESVPAIYSWSFTEPGSYSSQTYTTWDESVNYNDTKYDWYYNITGKGRLGDGLKGYNQYYDNETIHGCIPSTLTLGCLTTYYCDNYLPNPTRPDLSDKQVVVGENTAFWDYVKVWKNNELTHWWVPLPKGYKLSNGTHISNNTLIDLITGSVSTDSVVNDIYLDNVDPSTSLPIDYWEQIGWTYNTVPVQNVLLANAAIEIRKHPTIYSDTIATIESGTYIPITMYTNDTANEVDGIWYFCGSGWIKSDNTSLVSSNWNSDDFAIEEWKNDFAVKAANNKVVQYNYQLKPIANSVDAITGKTKYSSEQIRTGYFVWKNNLALDISKYGGTYSFWDGTGWIEAYNTSVRVITTATTYVIVPETIPYYRFPIVSDVYKMDVRYKGDRIKPSRVLNIDNDWVYVPAYDGWFYIKDKVNILE